VLKLQSSSGEEWEVSIASRISDNKIAEKGRSMPSKMALVDYKRCHPEKCDSGVCAAVLACSHKLLKQEAPYEMPMTDPSVCQGCGDCVRACPLKAIKIVTM
jgi:Fe-S-cluster-containing hydrogenase component 2